MAIYKTTGINISRAAWIVRNRAAVPATLRRGRLCSFPPAPSSCASSGIQIDVKLLAET
jgi:hypothetical protein